jgi:outer membrane murein-binding lipoprotein Lpp
VETRTRIERLESDIEDIKSDVSDLKDDVRRLGYGGLLAFMLLAGLMATISLINDYKVNRLQEDVSSLINDDKVNRLPADVSSLAVKVTKVSARMSGLERQNRQILTKLKALTDITPETPRLGKNTP